MIKLSDFLEIPPMGEVVAARDAEAKRWKYKQQRTYGAAKGSRLNSGWDTTPTSGQYELRTSLRILRARSRQQCRDNGNFKKFLGMAQRNIIGAGIQLQCRAAFATGMLNTRINRKVETAFWEWSRFENCTVSQKASFLDLQKLIVMTLARDGEVLVQKVPAKNRFGFALKTIDVSYLDETFNERLTNGRRVIMSVELDDDDRPTAYYLTTPSGDSYLPHRDRMTRKRVPAEEMLHFYLFAEDECQTRGVTWFHAALRDAKDLDGYKVGVITSAKAAAYTFATVTPPETEDITTDDEDGERPQLELAVEPLSIMEMPPGYELQQFDPKQPTQNHSEFYKSILADLATALDLPYFSLSGDYARVNYSSSRTGLLDEREFWRGLQQFVIEHFCQPVYAAWLDAAWVNGAVDLSFADYEKVRYPLWRARGWSWVDPQKEIKAHVTALENNVTTLTDVLHEQGKDVEEHFATIKFERELAAQYGIELKYGAQQKPTPEPAQAQETPAPDENRQFENDVFS